MRINKLSFLIGLSAVLFLVPLTAAQAKGPGLYLGGAWGAYSVKKSDLDANDDVLKAWVGFQFNDWFGIEGSWTDFNRLNNDSGDRFDADGKGLAAVLSFPVGNRSSVFVKGGAFWWNSKMSFSGVDTNDKGSDPFWGAGFKFGFNPHLALRFEVERYDVSDTHLNAVTAGVEFKF
jgi:OOP family OmpA-OmpF porin